MLIDQGWVDDNPDIVSFGKSIYNGYFLALLYSGRFDEVFELTKKWKDSLMYRGILGTYRASAWKRKMENLVNDDPDATVDALVRAARILSDVYRNDGYFKTANKQAIKIFEEIEFCFSRKDYCDKYTAQGLELLKFISENIVEISQSNSSFDISPLICKLAKIQIANNPFKASSWNELFNDSRYDYIDDKEDKPEGLTTVKISNRPKNKASFLFAKDIYGKDYFLHYKNFKDGGWRDWCQLSIGMSLDIVPEKKNGDNNKATNAREIYFAQQFSF